MKADLLSHTRSSRPRGQGGAKGNRGRIDRRSSSARRGRGRRHGRRDRRDVASQPDAFFLRASLTSLANEPWSLSDAPGVMLAGAHPAEGVANLARFLVHQILSPVTSQFSTEADVAFGAKLRFLP